MKKTFNILAILLIILGFGIIHNKNTALEVAGSISIGLGSLYFIVLLLFTRNKQK